MPRQGRGWLPTTVTSSQWGSRSPLCLVDICLLYILFITFNIHNNCMRQTLLPTFARSSLHTNDHSFLFDCVGSQVYLQCTHELGAHRCQAVPPFSASSGCLRGYPAAKGPVMLAPLLCPLKGKATAKDACQSVPWPWFPVAVEPLHGDLHTLSSVENCPP